MLMTKRIFPALTFKVRLFMPSRTIIFNGKFFLGNINIKFHPP